MKGSIQSRHSHRHYYFHWTAPGFLFRILGLCLCPFRVSEDLFGTTGLGEWVGGWLIGWLVAWVGGWVCCLWRSQTNLHQRATYPKSVRTLFQRGTPNNVSAVKIQVNVSRCNSQFQDSNHDPDEFRIAGCPPSRSNQNS